MLSNCSWGIEVKCDLTRLRREEILTIARLVLENVVVVIRGQQLSVENQISICKAMGDLEEVKTESLVRCPVDSQGRVLSQIQRVTGAKNSKGENLGLFPHDSELSWHANRASAEHDRKPLVWLYAVENTSSSRTSWINTLKVYEDLPSSLKDRLKSLRGYFGFAPGRYSPAANFKSHINKDPISLVRVNPITNQAGLYFPFLQLFGIEGMSEPEFQDFVDEIKQYMFNEKYIYHHDWSDGDVLISEQWFSIHKRWACSVENRLLHRITMDYQNLIVENRSGSTI